MSARSRHSAGRAPAAAEAPARSGVRRSGWHLAVALAALFAAVPELSAGPSVIRDEMLQDTAITPALGRGYSIATNTYQSMCLIDVVSTTPSYDFDYSFENIQASTEVTGSMSKTKANKGKTTTAQTTQRSRSTEGYTLSDEWSQSRTETDKGGKSTYQHMLATVSINVYYNSVDETKSKLSPAATKIIESKDLPGFFDACGMYYVRSISRRARIYSLITYSTSTGERDLALDSTIKSAIRSFSLTNTTTAAASSTVAASVPGGAEMIMGQEYVSPNGKFRTVFQNDGNLCIYKAGGLFDCPSTLRQYGASNVVEKDGRCYGYFPRALNQANAIYACRSYGAALATITSEGENVLVAGIANNDWVWLDGNDIEKEGTFVWGTGEAFQYNKWAPGQPDNWGNREEDCAHMWGGGTWNDEPCTTAMRYVCEAEQATQIWCSMTAGRGARVSVQDNDINIYDQAGKSIWTTSKDRVGKEGQTQLVMQDDGNLVLFSPGKEQIAATGTGNSSRGGQNGMMIGSLGKDLVTAQVTNTTAERTTEDRVSGKQTTKTTGSNIQISTKAIGLGKSANTTLISYDVDTFKKSVESAFKATLPDNVGKVSAIEVVPWMENTEFQSLFKLEEVTVPAFDKMGFPEMDLTDPSKPVQKTKKVLPYEQKRVLQTNAEFLAEVDRAARAKLNVFYKAKMCKAQIDADWMEQDPKTGEMFFPDDLDAIANAIEIVKASYGANCNPRNVDNMTELLAEACNDVPQCDYPIDIATIGDPAPGCEKAYEIEYRCTAPARRGIHHQAIAKEASGKSLTIDCLSPDNQPAAPAQPAVVAGQPPPGAADAPPTRPTVGQTNYVWNNRKPNESILLEDVAKMLSEDHLQRLWMEYDSFMYGGTGDDVEEVEKDPAARAAIARAILLGTKPELGYPKNIFPGAGRCIGELFSLGITAVPYRNIRQCQRIEETFATISGQKIDDYCMPRFTRVAGQASVEEAMDRDAKAGDSTNREVTAPPPGP